jgi:predicted Rossmann fold nucleotide-binding protein DprA/Smf involved in DNA uptake
LTEDNLLAKMDAGETYGLDELVLVTGIPAARVLTRLMELELSGQVGPVPGGRYARLLPRG